MAGIFKDIIVGLVLIGLVAAIVIGIFRLFGDLGLFVTLVSPVVLMVAYIIGSSVRLS